jgi:hypothetical protein
MTPGGGERRFVKDEAALLRHKREVDAHRTAQAILKRRHAANVALARIARATLGPTSDEVCDHDTSHAHLRGAS